MRHHLILLIVVLGSILCFGRSYGQLYESNCYFPQFGKPGEIDTVYGNYDGQQLGLDVFNPGAFTGYPEGKLFIEGLPQNPPFLSSVNPKAAFDLHNFTIEKKLPFNRDNIVSDFAQLHDSKHIDIYGIDGNRDNPRIYWSDDEGNYDSLRVTYLTIPKKKGYIRGLNGFSAGFPCEGHFTSDSVGDIILAISYVPIDSGLTLSYLALYKGGKDLFARGDTSFYDSLFEIPQVTFGNNLIKGDWRGKGIDDFIGIVNGDDNWFYFKNDPPFSLNKFFNALRYDTLLAKWQNPTITKNHGGIALRLFPKDSKDSSEDLYCGFEQVGNPVDDLDFFYKGGKDFGSKRIFAEKPDFLFHSPRFYSSELFGYYINPLEYVGDLTGRGDYLYRIWADLYTNAYEFYYVMGKFMNDQVDMSFRPEPNGTGSFATLDANADGKLDILEGMPIYSTTNDLANGKKNVGLLALIYGSDKLPHKDLSVNKPTIFTGNLKVFPNPAHRYITFLAPKSEVLNIAIFDILGRIVFATKRSGVDDGENITLNLPSLSNGPYILKVFDKEKVYLTQITIIN